MRSVKKMDRKIFSLLIVSLFLLSTYASFGTLANELSISKIYDGDTLDQENNETTGTVSCVGTGRGFNTAQSFKPSYNIITKIHLHKGGMYGSGGGDPSMNELALREELDGNNIAYIKKEVSLEQGTLYDWVEFDIPDTEVIPGNTYYIVWGTMEFLCEVGWYSTGWRYEGDPYPEGKAMKKDENGDWNYNSLAKDMHFKTFGREGNDGNLPPGNLEVISSTTEGKIDRYLTFQFRTSSNDNDKIKYRIGLQEKPELGKYEEPEEIITDLFNPSESNTVNINIEDPSVYWMKVTALDEKNAESTNSEEIGPIYVNDYKNSAPNKPLISGKREGKILKEYEYSATSWDCDKDQIWYMFDWADGTKSEWVGPYNSGETCSVTKIWLKPSHYDIRVKSKDGNDAESEWSDIIKVSMPINKHSDRTINFFQKIIQTHSNLKSLFKLILKL